MKRFIILTLLSLFLISTSFIGTVQTTEIKPNNEIIIQFQCSDPVLTPTEEYVKISTPFQSSSVLIPGHPQLPKISKTITLPFGSTISSITTEQDNSENTIVLSKKIIPAVQPSPISSQTASSIAPLMDEHIYHSSTIYPAKNIDYTLSTGLLDGTHVSFLTIKWYPYQYTPQTDELTYTKDITVTATYHPPQNTAIFPDEYDLVIITPNQFKSDLQDLADHKNSHGMKSFIKTLNEIYNQYPGRDQAEQIKYFIKDAVETYGIQYVLLIGSVDLTPIRTVAIPVFHEEDIITDMYYADIFDSQGAFSSWDSNNNNLFSEYNWNDGLLENVDIYPDVAVGRLPCKNNREVQTIINKIITYENTAAQESWFHRLLLMGGDTFPNHGILEGELVTSIIADSMSTYEFEPITLWTSDQTFDPFTINKKLTQGAGFMSYSGHGYEQGFGTSPPNVEERIEYFSPYLIGVFNKEKLPVIFFDACSTTKLDYTVEELLHWYPVPLARLFTWLEGEPYDMDTRFPCLSWQIVRKINGGGIAAIGSTRVAFTGVDASGAHWGAGFLNTHFFDAYEPGSHLASLFLTAKMDYLQSVGKECITLEEFILIGDPSLKLGGY